MAIHYQDFIQKNPEVCDGEAVITGTRITLRTVLACLADGMAPEEIMAEYPTLTHEALRAVIAFAAASAEEDLPAPHTLMAA
jgi:uncharacterized protein (DUF433 family)